MKLDFDLGNTRLKWHLHGAMPGGRASEYGAAAWRDIDSSSQSLNQLLVSVQKQNPDGIEAIDVLVSSVASADMESLFKRWLKDKFASVPNFVEVEKHFAGLSVVYEDVSSLGVDRWLAMLAAKEAASDSLLVVMDAGSALTVDYIRPGGEHEGGLIVPGLPLFCEALASGTGKLSPGSLTLTQNWKPGCDTVSAIAQGASAMYAGLANQALGYYIKKAETLGVGLQVILSGGDASALLPWCEQLRCEQAEHKKPGATTISMEINKNDYLVLDGLDIWRRARHQQI